MLSRRPGAGVALAAFGAASLTGLPAQAATYGLTARTQVVGTDFHIKAGAEDTLYGLAEKYGIGSEEIIRANPGVDPWLPGEGTDILIPGRQILPPGPREGIVINIPEHRLYYYPPPQPGKHGAVVITYPVSIGSLDWQTPQGRTRIIQKISNPAWHPPQSIREEHKKNGDPLPAVVPPGPKNPLGKFALRLDLSPGDYMIHGTNNPLAVGMPVTHGCVRLYPRDIESLFAQVPVGTPVTLVNIPVKVAAVNGELLVQAAPPADSAQPAHAARELMDRLSRTATEPGMDLARIETALTEATGVLVNVGRIPDAEPLAKAMSVSLRARPAVSPHAGHAPRRGLTARNAPS